MTLRSISQADLNLRNFLGIDAWILHKRKDSTFYHYLMIQVSIHSTKLLSFCHIVIITNYECRDIISDIEFFFIQIQNLSYFFSYWFPELLEYDVIIQNPYRYMFCHVWTGKPFHITSIYIKCIILPLVHTTSYSMDYPLWSLSQFES